MSARIHDLASAAAYLEGLINLEKKPARMAGRLGLGPIRELVARAGHPERRLAAIHVAGSKGKGSVCLIIEALARALGLRTGVFTSPHLERWSERYRLDGREISGPQLAAAVARLQPLIDEQCACGPPRVPSFFDATTLVALQLFAEHRVDCAVLEVGLGGRLDSTNVAEPSVTCITTIEREHTRFLGQTIAGIAFEKAGILKRGVPCVVGALSPEALRVAEERAAALQAPLLRLGSEFELAAEVRPGGGSRFELRCSDGFEIAAELSLEGIHQAHNAALALVCIRSFCQQREEGFSDADLKSAAKQAFATLSLPGRVAVLQREPWVVVDSAHTEASARALIAVLDTIPSQERHLVLAISADKQLQSVLQQLLEGASSVVLTRAEKNRSLDPEKLAILVKELAPSLKIQIEPDPRRALEQARAALKPQHLLCATGSFYLAGIANELFLGTENARAGSSCLTTRGEG